MKAFEKGKSYHVNGGGIITVTKVTKEFVTFDGDFHGKRRINRCFENGLFGLGEHILIPSQYPSLKYFCFAGHEK